MSKAILFTVVLCTSVCTSFISPDWGFYGHRKINRMAVFTLPPDLIGFFKTHIEYLTEHSIDPDKRRYASKFEAVRHYIDIDHWDVYPFDKVPRDWTNAILQYADFRYVNSRGDTTVYKWPCNTADSTAVYEVLNISCDQDNLFFSEFIEPIFYRDDQMIEIDEVNGKFGEGGKVFNGRGSIEFIDHFSEYGVLPYHLKTYYNKLVQAFESQNSKKILRFAAEIGHYIGDAHVPLHTTENYNGQLSDQLGIHAFWESRLPELFADETYDFFVGRADYVEDVGDYFWEVVMKSHSYLAQVLDEEKSLSVDYPQDQQYCFEDRLERSVRTQCEEYAGAYHQNLDGMVEERMQDAVHAIGSIWYSAWVDAGSPDLGDMIELNIVQQEQDSLEQNDSKGRFFGRDHSN